MKTWSHILGFLSTNTPCALISVIETSGSTPREVGARIIVNQKGAFHGTIGGGNMENTSLQNARKMLQTGLEALSIKKYLLGPELGQCCGGAVKVMSEVFLPERIGEVKALARAEADSPIISTGTIGDTHVTRSIIEGTEQTLGIDSEGQLIENFGIKNQAVYVFGAGHVGRALMLTLAPLPLDVTWIDSRSDEFPKVMPANFKAITHSEPHTLLASAPSDAHILILTHDHALDFDIVFAALKMQCFPYVGVIGSKTKKARFVSKLKKAGLAQDMIDPMICPIGITGIKSKKPAAIAVSITAELLCNIEI